MINLNKERFLETDFVNDFIKCYMAKAPNAPLKQMVYEIFGNNCENINDLEEFSLSFDNLVDSITSTYQAIDGKLKYCYAKDINFDVTNDVENNIRQISQEIVKSKIENTLNDAVDSGKDRKSVYVSEKFQKYAECVNLELTDDGLSSKFLELFTIIKSKDFFDRTKLVQSVFDEIDFIKQEFRLCHELNIPNNISDNDQDNLKLVANLIVEADMIDQLNELAAQCEEIGTAADIL